MLDEVMQLIQQHSKITDELLNECKLKVADYLATIDADKNLMESYMNQYYSEMAKNHRANSRLSVTLSTIAKHLTAIEEEDETEEEIQQASRVLTSISNQFNRQTSAMDTASSYCDSPKNMKNNLSMNYQSDAISASASYADMVLGLRDNKRKLSENSITDEDYEFDCENQRH